MPMIPCEYYGGEEYLFEDLVSSTTIASFARDSYHNFSFTIPAKTGYTPKLAFIRVFTSSGSVQPIVPYPNVVPLTSNTFSANGYYNFNSNAYSNPITNVKCAAIIMYKKNS